MAVILFPSLSPSHANTIRTKNIYNSLLCHASRATNSFKLSSSAPPGNSRTAKTRAQNEKSGNEVSSSTSTTTIDDDEEEEEEEELMNLPVEIPARDYVTLTACAVGLLTGLGVVLFNTAVHEIRDIFWDGIPLRGASWLREEPIEEIWQRVIFVPVSGGIIVGLLNSLRSSLKHQASDDPSSSIHKIKDVFSPVLKAIAAAITLGTGNSLGPEGPSVEIGSSIAKGFGNLLNWSDGKRLSLVAAGSAAGISSGFNASVAGCFFAVESVLWPSSSDSFSSLPNATPIVILSSVIASVISQVGLGSDPAFIVPQYDFRSPTELPLYLLLGVICGLISLTLSKLTSLSIQTISTIQAHTNIPKPLFPIFGSFLTGLLALKYPEVLYWGFENVDVLLESRPFTTGLSASILLQLVGVKIVATSVCRATGLVGGFYAPSLFIGAATGMAYGRLVKELVHVSLLDVASPQAYGLVGMAATLAGVCQVPLTSVLLLFELTQDYRIVLPLLGAVGLSSWISTSLNQNNSENKTRTKSTSEKDDDYSNDDNISSSSAELCLLESSLCVYEEKIEFLSEFVRNLNVSQAMKRNYISVSMESPIVEVVNEIIQEKQSFVIIVDNDGSLLGLLTLVLIQDFIKCKMTTTNTTDENYEVGEILVSDICEIDEKRCRISRVTNDMSLIEVLKMMDTQNVDRFPVVLSDSECVIGFIDRDSINIASRAIVAKEILSSSYLFKHKRPGS